MSHELSIVNGKAEAYYADKAAWHGLGNVVEGARTSQEVIELAHLNWQVIQVPAFGEILEGDKTITIPTRHKVNLRADTKTCLGVVGPTYTVVQNSEAFKFMDDLTYNGHLLYEAAGALKGGKDIWLLARFPNDFYVTDDDVNRDYILLLNSHDGTKALQIIPTSIRVVCQNTVNYSLHVNEVNKDAKYKTRHSTNILSRTKDAMETLGIMSYSRQIMQEIMRDLTKKTVDSNYVEDFINKMFPQPSVEKVAKPELVLSRWGEKKGLLRSNFESQDITSATKNTRYGLLQAVSYYTDHQMQTKGADDNARADNKFYNVFIGAGNNMKQEALSYLMK